METINYLSKDTKCPECKEEFKIVLDLEKHFLLEHEDDKKHIHSQHEGVKHTCKECGQQYKSYSGLKKHIHSQHEGFRYACK